jgi:RinA family phage transcriptional activator
MQKKYKMALYKYLEFELRYYQENMKELEQLRADIIEATPNAPEAKISKTNKVHRPVEQKVLGLLDLRRAIQLEKLNFAVHKAYERAPEDMQKFIKLYFWEDLPWQQVIIEVSISEKCFWQWRDKILTAIALDLGLITAENY